MILSVIGGVLVMLGMLGYEPGTTPGLVVVGFVLIAAGVFFEVFIVEGAADIDRQIDSALWCTTCESTDRDCHCQ